MNADERRLGEAARSDARAASPTVRLEGLIAAPGELDFAALAALPDQVADVGTLSPGRVGGAVPVRALLAGCGLRADAAQLVVVSRDGRFRAALALRAADTALLVYRLGDAPLPASAGGPLRFLIPEATACGLDGPDACANVKDVGVLRVA